MAKKKGSGTKAAAKQEAKEQKKKKQEEKASKAAKKNSKKVRLNGVCTTRICTVASEYRWRQEGWASIC